MLIDWFTVGAQALNFLILVWLLKRFLYRPVLAAVDARAKLVATELADAGKKKAEAENEQREFRQKNEELERQRSGLLSKARGEAKAERQRLLDEARVAADALTSKRQEALSLDARNLEETITRRAQQEVFAIARKALTDLAATDLEERIVEVFVRRLREMDGPSKDRLCEALRTATDPALIHSAFDLSPERRAELSKALTETFASQIPVRFETKPDLVGGIELVSNGEKIAWSISEYLEVMSQEIGVLLKPKSAPVLAKKISPSPAPIPAPTSV